MNPNRHDKKHKNPLRSCKKNAKIDLVILVLEYMYN